MVGTPLATRLFDADPNALRARICDDMLIIIQWGRR
jgi:hypothetical protein